MNLTLHPSARQCLHSQIADALRNRLQEEGLAVGEQLPTSRQLAKELGVSRSTVVRAYEQLEREGWIEGRVGMGTVVRGRPTVKPPRTPNWDLLLTSRIQEPDPTYQDVLEMLSNRELLSFAGGLPSAEFFPSAAFQKISDDVLSHQGPRLLQWCPVDGYPPLRSWIAHRIGCCPEDVLVLSGSTQGIHLLVQAFVNPGDTVIVESPTYAGALQAFRAAGARIVSVSTGPDGIDLERLDRTLRQVTAKFLYVIPTYNNPTGGMLSLRKRHELLALASQHGLPIVEDDPYSSLRYDGPAVPSLHALDHGQSVLYLSTFSKSLFPGLRIGWLVAPSAIIHRLGCLRNLIDLFSNSHAQATLYEFCKRGHLDNHLQHVRDQYAARRDVMVNALRKYCPQVSFDVPHGGLFLWVKLPEGVDSPTVLREAVAMNLAFIAGPLFYDQAGGEDRIRLSFAGQPETLITDGMRKLGLVLQRVRPAKKDREPVSGPGFVV